MTVLPVFHTLNNQSDGVKNLIRMEFSFDGVIYRFALNPQEYMQSESNRATVTQTKRGAWVDSFGGGLPTIVMKGHTGFKTKDQLSSSTGFKKFKDLRDMIRRVYFSSEPGTNDIKEMVFYNYTDGESWVVLPTKFELLRSASRPLLYQYTINLTCLRPYGIPGNASKSSINMGVSYEGGK